MDTWRCPNCEASTLVPVYHLYSASHGAPAVLLANDRHHIGIADIGMVHGVRACWSCGHVWTKLDPEKLRAHLETYGSELVKQHLVAARSGPYEGLPDIPEARRAADHAAEIDLLVLDRREVEAKRRYRELTRSTWDETFRIMARWDNLGRAQKLALFGWQPTKKPQADEASMMDHPMRDRFLDG